MFRSRPDLWGSASVYAVRVFNVALGAGLAIFAARWLAPAGQGQYATIAAAVDMGSQILNFGISSGLLVVLSREPGGLRLARSRVYELAAASLLILVLSLGLPSWLGAKALLFAWWPILALWIPLKLIRLHQTAMLTALKAYRPVAFAELAGRVASVLLGVAALLALRDLRTYLGALVAADAIAALLAGAALRRGAEAPMASPSSKRDLARQIARVALRAYPLLLLPWLVIRADLLLVRLFRGPVETGLYSIAAQVVEIGLLLPSTLGGFLVPALARDGATAGDLWRLCRWLALVLLGCAAIAAIVGRPAIRLLFGAAYSDSYGALLLLLPGFWALSLETLLMQHFALADYPPFLTRYWLITAGVNLGLNLVVIPRFGMLGAAATSSFGYAVIFVLVLRRFLRETKLKIGLTGPGLLRWPGGAGS